MYSRDQDLLDIMTGVLGENCARRRRNNKVFFNGRYVKYPFENGLGELEREDTYECLIGYLVNPHPEPANFRDWIYHTFGDGIAGKYLVPYNEKIWKVPLEEIGLEWVERVPKPPMEDIVKSALGIETEGYVHQLYFYYPKFGGIESLIKAFVGENAGVVTDFEARSVRRKGNSWVVSNGSIERDYDRLVVTAPVREAVRFFQGVPDEVLRAAGRLSHNAVRVVLVGIGNDSLMDKSGVYIPDGTVVPHRVCFMGFFSPDNVPAGKSSLIAEVTTHEGHEFHRVSDSSITEMVLDDLHRIGIIDRSDVVTTDVTNFEYGYVIHDSEHRRNTAIVKEYFASLGVKLHGRFAEFEYINMDEVIRRSAALARELDGD